MFWKAQIQLNFGKQMLWINGNINEIKILKIQISHTFTHSLATCNCSDGMTPACDKTP